MLLAAGAVFNEFAGVSYNAMLPQVSTPATIGRVSGFGWSMGYFGGIFLLLICYVGFIAPDVGWFGVTSEGGLNIRTVAVFSAAWFAIFAAAGAVRGSRRSPPGPSAAPGQLLRLVRAAGQRHPGAVPSAIATRSYFLIASALYRDGLAAVFTFGAILAVTVYGMAQSTVLIFGVAANVVAALGALGWAGSRTGSARRRIDHDLAGRADRDRR